MEVPDFRSKREPQIADFLWGAAFDFRTPRSQFAIRRWLGSARAGIEKDGPSRRFPIGSCARLPLDSHTCSHTSRSQFTLRRWLGSATFEIGKETPNRRFLMGNCARLPDSTITVHHKRATIGTSFLIPIGKLQKWPPNPPPDPAPWSRPHTGILLSP